jgi:hypothetical protein
MENKLKKYIEFLNEKVDKIDISKFNSIPKDHYTIYNDLKELSLQLNNDIDIPFNKKINFGGIYIDLSIVISNEYYSNIN